jgi:hypothetical protein
MRVLSIQMLGQAHVRMPKPSPCVVFCCLVISIEVRTLTYVITAAPYDGRLFGSHVRSRVAARHTDLTNNHLVVDNGSDVATYTLLHGCQYCWPGPVRATCPIQGIQITPVELTLGGAPLQSFVKCFT